MIRFSGLASGIDTEGIIKELMKAETAKVDTIKKEQTKLKWKKEVWEETNTELLNFYRTALFKFKSQGTYLSKKVNVSDESALGVKTTVNTVKGIHTMSVSKLAKNSFLAGNEITKDENGNALDPDLSTKAGDLYDFSKAGKMDIGLSISTDGKNFTEVSINTSDTMAQIVEKIKSVDDGIEVSFDEEHNRFFFSTKDTGKDKVVQIRGANGTDGETGLINAMGFSSNYEMTGSVASDALPLSSAVSIGIKNSSGTYQSVQIDTSDTMADIVTKIKAVDPKIQCSYDGDTKKLSIGADYEVDIKMPDGSDITKDNDQYNFLTKLGFNVNKEVSSAVTGSKGEDSQYTYNGIDLTSDSNEVSVNGMTVTLKTTTSSDVTINITQDSEAIYNNVKDFIKAYNELIEKIDDKYSAIKVKGLEPLTDEQKKAMDSDDVKAWEKKIKDSILRRDNILFSLTGSMRSILSASVGIDPDTLPEDFQVLSDIGIVTGRYKEKGKLHIKGDENDPEYAVYDNKLKEAIESDPDKVAKLLSSVGEEMYNMMKDKMKHAKGLSRALCFYNNEPIEDKIDDYDDKIKDLQKKLTVKEKRYYNQFTAMEQMIQRMQAQGDQMMSMLGGGGA
jgi:flagellar hook-associated protein 2